MKLKIIKRKIETVETDLDFPVYLYFQDEFGQDELVKITEKCKLTIKWDLSSVNISVDYRFYVEEFKENAITTKEHFEERYNDAMKQLAGCYE
jgi:hypothetical protein